MQSTIKNFLLITLISTALAPYEALPVESKGLFSLSKSKLIYNAEAKGPAQILELDANQKYKLEIINLSRNIVQSDIKSKKRY